MRKDDIISSYTLLYECMDAESKEKLQSLEVSNSFPVFSKHRYIGGDIRGSQDCFISPIYKMGTYDLITM